ncbi:hypothetical protein M0R88_16055 [Halorussus gelatinilyticus]|uniref:Uncharacterized protein n=1 Tax=Halorussus gelatinilyticus TaxID=2937524 RepID=A0A8U0IH26_9EURY|nr:hypothetical protein [Halorussus gelatinilyticus]UPW00015.1 hypothetical protein M0R88_16055 [Halorussus gelatinilyticus]
MQKRTTALYVAFFFLVATAAFTVLTVTEQPTASVENPEYELSAGENFTVDGRTYNVSDLSAQMSEGSVVRSASATWVNESARYTATWANNSTVTYRNDTYRVLIPNVSNPSEATLREVRPLGNNTTTIQQGGQSYVVVNESDGNRSLVPVSEYKRQQFGEAQTRRLTVGSTFQYANNSTSVENITASAVKLAWDAPRTNTLEFGKTTAMRTTLIRSGTPTKMAFPAGGNNVTLNGQTYTTHYPDNSTLVLSNQAAEYHAQLDTVRHKHERFAGLWGVLILSVLAAFTMIALAFLPNK